MSLTKHRDLRTGQPLWLQTRRPWIGVSDEAWPRATVDCVVIGAGISGALVADALLQAGKSVVVLDRRMPVSGSTPASTALLQFEIDTPLIRLRHQIGARRAERAWLRSYAAVQALALRVRELRLRCDLRRRRALYLPGNLLDVGGLKKEQIARENAGLPSVFIDRAALMARTGIDRAGALLSQGAADVDPVKLTVGLLRSVRARGARIFWPVDVTALEAEATGVLVTTSTQKTLKARSVVLATGYELMKHVPRDGHKIISTWSIATRRQPHALWPNKELVWEAADPYLYVRTSADGRVVMGGEDEEIAAALERDALLPEKTARLAAKLGSLFPSLDPTPEFAWAGTFGESETGLPTVGAVPGMANCYAVLGFGGNGITFSMMAAQMLSRAVAGDSDPDRELFAFAGA